MSRSWTALWGRSFDRFDTGRGIQPLTPPGTMVKRAVQVFGRHTVNHLTIGMSRFGISIPGIWGSSIGMVVEVPGRKSGKLRLTPMGYVRASEDRLLAVAEHGLRSDWAQNVLAAGKASVWIGPVRFPVKARLRDDLDPNDVVAKMNPLWALLVRRLAAEPKVIEFQLGAAAK